MRRLIVLSTLLASCLPTPCPRLALPDLASCLISTDGAPDDTFEPVALELGGTVTEVGTGEPPLGCFDGFDHPGAASPELADFAWARLQDGDGTEWVAGFAAPGVSTSAFPAVGSPIEIDYAFQQGGFSPNVGHLTVRDGDGALLGWHNDSGSLEDAVLPDEVSLERGGVLCTQADSCGSWQLYGLRVDVNGDSGPLEHGSTAGFGGLTFVHGGHAAQLPSAAPTCPDWYVAYLRVAAFR